MNNAIVGTLSFIAGAAIGGFVVYKYLDEKYKARSDEEIQSVKDAFTVPRTKINKKPEPEKKNDVLDKNNLAEEHKKIASRYTKYSGSEDSSVQYPWDKDKIKVISPDEFGMEEGYQEISLTMYADGIVADEDDEVIDDPKKIVGDALERIGEFEDDAIHVQDTERKLYYEILVDNKKYEEATGKSLPQDKED